MLNFAQKGGLVQIVYRDNSGCSFVRLRWNSNFLSGVESGITPVLLPNVVMDPSWLSVTRAIVMQRPVSDPDIDLLKRLKALQPKFQYKILAEFDDLCWLSKGQGIPEYNMASLTFKMEEVSKRVAAALQFVDEVIVSTDYLKESLEREYGFTATRVIKNVIPRYLWSFDRKPDLTADLIKPRILYTGAPQHYRNPIPPCPQYPNGVGALTGDWYQVWIDFILKNVREDKIEFIVMGALPYFWEPIKDKIQFIPWVDCNTFPRTVQAIHADFQMAPLADNEFNKCKSDLRFLESCGIGAVFIGSYWDRSPYSSVHPLSRIEPGITLAQFEERFWNLTTKDAFNAVKNWQYNYLNTCNRYLESDGHLNELLSAFDNSNILTKLI